MLSYTFTKNNKKALYEQLYERIRNDILSGIIPSGSKLPGKRPFAQHLGLSVITVENAYARLNEEGYIRSIPRKGFFAEDIQCQKPVKTNKSLTDTSDIFSKINISPKKKIDFLADLDSNDIPSALLPLKMWSRLAKDAGDYIADSVNSKMPTGGSYMLRNEICKHLRSFRGIETTPEQIIVGAGSEYLYGLVVQLLGRQKIIALENPGYKKLSEIYRMHGTGCVYIDTQSDKKTLSKELNLLKADLTHISPSHHFPTGRIMPVSKRYELLSWANEKPQRFIIEDDYDAEFRFLGRPVPTLFGMDEGNSVIYLNTFSKTISPTLRISYMVLPPKLCRTFYDKLGFLSCTVSSLNQYILARFLGEGFFEKHLNRARTYYRRIRDCLISEFKKLPESNAFEILEEASGLHFLLRINTKINDNLLCSRLSKQGINVTALSSYYTGSDIDTEHTLIIKYGGLDAARIPEIARRIATVV